MGIHFKLRTIIKFKINVHDQQLFNSQNVIRLTQILN